MSTHLWSASRAIPVDVDTAFTRTLPLPLPQLFSRWYGPITPIKAVDDAPATWDTAGQTRTIVQVGGGTMREQLTKVDAPHSFDYRLSELTGALKPLVSGIEGQWRFEPAGTGTKVTWQWEVRPNGVVGSVALPAFARLWRGYARQALEELETLLLASS